MPRDAASDGLVRVRPASLVGRARPEPTVAWLAAGAAACACAATALIDPTEQRMTPGCPFQMVTGWWCPFCGATRSLSKLMRGEWASAFRYNALLVIAIPLMVAVWFAFAVPSETGWRATVRARGARLSVAAGVLCVVFVAVRNIGVDPFTGLRFPGA